MSEKEFAIFMLGMRKTYPKDNLPSDSDGMKIWYEMLKDIPYDTATAFLKRWSMSQRWSPTIADIRQGVVEITQKPIPDWGQAWAEVEKAVSRYGYPRPYEAMEMMSPLTRSAVKRLGYQAICESENPEATRAHFRSIYEELAKREKENMALPESLKSEIESIRQENLWNEAIEDRSFSEMMPSVSYAGLNEKELEDIAGVNAPIGNQP